MLNDNIKNLILGTINLYGNSNLNQSIIDEGVQKLKQAKELLTVDNSEPLSNLKVEYDKQYTDITSQKNGKETCKGNSSFDNI